MRLGQPQRCVHVGDRESDIYELYRLAKDLGSHFVVRKVVDRLAGNGDHTVASEIRGIQSAGTHVIELRRDADPAVALTSSEIASLDRLVSDAGTRRAKSGTVLLDLIKRARLGGDLARMSGPPPGNTVIWRGLRRLAGIQPGTDIKNVPTYGVSQAGLSRLV